MTKENASRYLSIVQALADGKTVQFLDTDDNWKDRVSHNFGNTPDRYRIKPEPVMIPLGPEDVPPGSAFRQRHYNPGVWHGAIFATCDGVTIGLANGFEFISNETLRSLYEIKRPGEDWKPCYKPANE